jgi:hypothetical protein
LLYASLFVWAVGYEYWNPKMDSGAENWAAWLPYLAAAFGVFWVALIRQRWMAFRGRPGPLIIQLLKPILSLAFFVLILLNRANFRQMSGVGPETVVLLAGVTLSLAMAVVGELSAARGNRNAFILPPLLALIAVLCLAAFIHPDMGIWDQLYLYRGNLRWTGPFRSPNEFGMVMALAVTMQ